MEEPSDSIASQVKKQLVAFMCDKGIFNSAAESERFLDDLSAFFVSALKHRESIAQAVDRQMHRVPDVLKAACEHIAQTASQCRPSEPQLSPIQVESLVHEILREGASLTGFEFKKNGDDDGTTCSTESEQAQQDPRINSEITALVPIAQLVAEQNYPLLTQVLAVDRLTKQSDRLEATIAACKTAMLLQEANQPDNAQVDHLAGKMVANAGGMVAATIEHTAFEMVTWGASELVRFGCSRVLGPQVGEVAAEMTKAVFHVAKEPIQEVVGGFIEHQVKPALEHGAQVAQNALNHACNLVRNLFSW